MADTAHELIEKYQPAKAKTRICTADEWAAVGLFVRGCVEPLSYLSPRGVRPYLTAMTSLAVWAYRQGFDLSPEVVLSGGAIEHFVSQLANSKATHRSRLRRLATANDVEVVRTNAPGYRRPPPKAPYSVDETTALMEFATSLSNQNRRVGLEAVLLLGLGCGLHRSSLRNVSAASVHSHGSSRDRCVARAQAP